MAASGGGARRAACRRPDIRRAIEQTARFQRLDQTLQETKILHAAPLGQRQRQRLQVIVAQHQSRDLIRHFGKQGIAAVERQAAVAPGNAQCDLDVDLHIGGVDAGGIVDRVGIKPDAAERRLDPAALGHAEIGAFADDLAAQILTADPDGVVGAVADRLVGLSGGADVGADAAEEQQIDRRLEQGADQFLRGECHCNHAAKPRREGCGGYVSNSTRTWL